jgi:hypothetical protein
VKFHGAAWQLVVPSTEVQVDDMAVLYPSKSKNGTWVGSVAGQELKNAYLYLISKLHLTKPFKERQLT